MFFRSTRFFLIVFTVFFFWPTTSILAQGISPEKAAQQMTVSDGFTAEFVASEPLVRQPVAIDFDSRGRLWVIQYLQYPNPAGLKRIKVDQHTRSKYDRVPKPPPHGPKGTDRLTILEDTDGDGRMDHAKDFVNGDQKIEIIALTNGGYFDQAGKVTGGKKKANGIVFVLSAEGDIIDQYDVGSPRYWGDAFVCNIDNDPFLELVISGSGGLDVIKTRGFGTNTEHFQPRRNYQRLNVVPWAYEDSYFIYRGTKEGVVNLTDNLILKNRLANIAPSESFPQNYSPHPPTVSLINSRTNREHQSKRQLKLTSFRKPEKSYFLIS